MTIFNQITTLENEASEFGFQWENTEQIMAQILSECAEVSAHLKEEQNPPELQEEIGDLLHAVFSLCVFCKLDPEQTLVQTLDKFSARLKAVKTIAEEQGAVNLQGRSFEELMLVWAEAKKRTSSIYS